MKVLNCHKMPEDFLSSRAGGAQVGWLKTIPRFKQNSFLDLLGLRFHEMVEATRLRLRTHFQLATNRNSQNSTILHLQQFNRDTTTERVGKRVNITTSLETHLLGLYSHTYTFLQCKRINAKIEEGGALLLWQWRSALCCPQ